MPINNAKNNLISILIISILVIITLAISGSVSHAAANNSYWLKINKQRNVITAYRNVDGKWKPVRAMLCTTGAVDTPTPSGTFKGGYKARWLHMVDEHKVSTYEQYTMLLNSAKQIYIHSVWYYHPNHSAQATAEFNRLGERGSHGCVRTSTMDAKWIYDNCKVGTKITIYSSSKSGPLGKPKAIYSSSGWDPTDPAKGNPSFNMRKPVITIKKSKPKTVTYGDSYDLTAKVVAKDPNSLMNISDRLKVKSTYKWNSSKKKWSKTKFSTQQLGTFKIRYYVNDPYSRSASKYFKIKVTDTVKPTIIGAYDKNVEYNTASAVNGVTATQPSASRTDALKVTVISPAGAKSVMTYAAATKYILNQLGTYTVTYTVDNKYAPHRTATKIVKYTVVDTSVPVISGAADNTIKASANTVDLMSGVTASQASGNIPTSNITVTVKDKDGKPVTPTSGTTYTFSSAAIGDTYTVTYTVANMYYPAITATKTVTITVKDSTPAQP